MDALATCHSASIQNTLGAPFTLRIAGGLRTHWPSGACSMNAARNMYHTSLQCYPWRARRQGQVTLRVTGATRVDIEHSGNAGGINVTYRWTEAWERVHNSLDQHYKSARFVDIYDNIAFYEYGDPRAMLNSKTKHELEDFIIFSGLTLTNMWTNVTYVMQFYKFVHEMEKIWFYGSILKPNKRLRCLMLSQNALMWLLCRTCNEIVHESGI